MPTPTVIMHMHIRTIHQQLFQEYYFKDYLHCISSSKHCSSRMKLMLDQILLMAMQNTV